MKFDIDENYRITSDRNQWLIQQSRVRKGKKTWQSFAYFITLEKCTRHLGQLLCRELETEGVVEALRGIDDITAKISRALSPDFRVVKGIEDENASCKEVDHKAAPPASSQPYRANKGNPGGGS